MQKKQNKKEYFSEELKALPEGAQVLKVEFNLIIFERIGDLRPILENSGVPHSGVIGLTSYKSRTKGKHNLFSVYVPKRLANLDSTLHNLGHEVAHVVNYVCDRQGVSRPFPMTCQEYDTEE